MKRALFLCIAMFAFASSARGQSWDIAAMAGYVLPYDFANVSRDVDSAGFAGGLSFDASGTYTFSPHWGAEFLWSSQPSAYQVEVNDVAGDVFSLTINQFHGNLVYQFGDRGARVNPFLFAGAGATTFMATDIPTETHFSMGLGGGVKVYPWKSLGLRGQLRYRPTWLNDKDAANFCDPFGFCQSMIRQLELSGGITVRF